MPKPRIHRIALALSLAALSACERGPRFDAEAAELLAGASRMGTRFGADTTAGYRGALGMVVAARLTEGGGVVVLDGAAPYVKVFGRDGRLRSAFVDAGDGPGEIRRPGTLAVRGDSVVLVADGAGRIQLFDLDGRPAPGAARTGFPVLAAADCAGRWLLYGPRRRPGGAAPLWLHLAGGPGGAVSDAYPDPPGPGVVPVGIAYGVAEAGGAVLLRHELGARAKVLRVPCDGEAPGELYVGEARPETRRVATRAGREAMGIEAGQRTQAGVAPLGGGVLMADMVSGAREADTYTELTLAAGGTVRRLAVPGIYAIRDARPGLGVLLETPDPLPVVFLVPERALLRLFRRR